MIDGAGSDDRETVKQNALARAAEIEGRGVRRARESEASARRWHIVHVSYKFERGVENEASFVAKQIANAGFEVYSPKLRRLVVPKSNRLTASQRKIRHLLGVEKIEPMFPRYEFVRFNPIGDNWHDIFRMTGVHGMLCANNLPVPMPEAFVDGLRAREVNGAIPGETAAVQMFSVGDVVRIKGGSMAGLTGPIERLDERGRIRLLLSLFGGAPVELTIEEIEKA